MWMSSIFVVLEEAAAIDRANICSFNLNYHKNAQIYSHFFLFYDIFEKIFAHLYLWKN